MKGCIYIAFQYIVYVYILGKVKEILHNFHILRKNVQGVYEKKYKIALKILRKNIYYSCE